MIEKVASAVCDLYDPYELADEGATEEELYDETLRLLETEPETIAAWLEGTVRIAPPMTARNDIIDWKGR